MTLRSHLRLYPDPVLRRKALPITAMDGKIHTLMKTMANIMYTCQGIGMAAPQLGVLHRVIVTDVGEGLLALANPEILSREGEEQLFEGCLSLPGVTVNVRRQTLVVVGGIDSDGKECERVITGLAARVIQHEIDHLNGVLILDHGPVVAVEPRDEPPGS
jgi:peptide deformylase